MHAHTPPRHGLAGELPRRAPATPENTPCEPMDDEEAFHEIAKRFRYVLDHAAIGMALVGLDGRFLIVNRLLCDLVGRSGEEMLTTNFQAVTYPDDVGPGLALLDEVLAGRAPSAQLEKRYLRPDGSTKWVHLAFSPVTDPTGRARCLFTQVIGLTNKRAAAEATALLASVVDWSDDAIITNTSRARSRAGTGGPNDSTATPPRRRLAGQSPSWPRRTGPTNCPVCSGDLVRASPWRTTGR